METVKSACLRWPDLPKNTFKAAGINYNPLAGLTNAMSYSDLSHLDLVQACLASDEAAWGEFLARYEQTISVAVLRTALRWGYASNAVLEDLSAETYLKLCADGFALLRHFEFRTDAGIYGFLKVVAANVVHDHFRQRHAQKRGAEVTIEDLYQSAETPDPDRLDEIERGVLLREVEEALLQVTGTEGVRDRTIFWLYYRQGFPANAIAKVAGLDLTSKGIESVIHRLTVAVRERLTQKSATCVAVQSEKGVSEESSF